MAALFAYIFMFLIIGALKLVTFVLCIPIWIIQLLLGIGGKSASSGKHDDVPYTEYDEFDWWQDNQGL